MKLFSNQYEKATNQLWQKAEKHRPIHQHKQLGEVVDTGLKIQRTCLLEFNTEPNKIDKHYYLNKIIKFGETKIITKHNFFTLI